MKSRFRSGAQLLSVGIVLAAFCLLPELVLANIPGGGAVAGDASGSVSATTPCATDGGNFSTSGGILLLDESLGPASGTAAVHCTLSTVNAGALAIDDPATIDGGAISDILDFVPSASGGSDVYLYSVGDNGFTQADANNFTVAASITEFNTGGTYTVYDSGFFPPANGGEGTCVFSQSGSTLTLTGCTSNGYIINSPEENPTAAEPGSFLLLSLVIVAGFFYARRKQLGIA